MLLLLTFGLRYLPLASCFGIPKCTFCDQNSRATVFNCYTITLKMKSQGDCKQRPTCYLLTSLRDHSVNYIGTTTQKLSDRLAYHNTVKSHLEGKHPQKGPWICTAIATGFGDDMQVMRKFHRLWTKEKEVASCGLSFDAIAKIGAIIQCNTH